MLVNERPEENRNPEFDNEASLREADSRMGLKRVIEQYGFAPENGNWKSFACPFCKKKAKAGVFQHEGVEMFKCQSTSCPTGAKAMPAVQFIAFQSGLSNKDAFINYLKMAGVWKDRTKFKSSKTEEPKPGPAATDAEQASAAGVEPGPAESATEKASEGAGEKSEEGATAKPGGSEASGTPAVPAPAPIEPPSSEPSPSASLAGADKAEDAPSALPGAAAPSAPGIKESESEAEPDGWRSLREFYSRLTLSDKDRESLWVNRGLEYRTIAALRFRSNPKSNRDILFELEKKYGIDELLASGLWLREDAGRKKKRRPNSQFSGMGIVGKKPIAKDHQGDSEDGADLTWGWNLPILIPYFEDNGDLIGLRPHKGMGKSGSLVGTPRAYIPRGAGGPMDGAPEVFYTVIITEGEFKAAALWQTLGVGRLDGVHPLGIVALPGISFGKNYEVREVLDDWLMRVNCREVVVVFDSEEKSDPELESYKQDKSKRFDAQIWARYLATDIAQKLHIRGRVGNLPNAWRNSKGKADWDGAMAEIAHGKGLRVEK